MPTLTSRQVVELKRMLDTGDLADYRPDNRVWRQVQRRLILHLLAQMAAMVALCALVIWVVNVMAGGK